MTDDVIHILATGGTIDSYYDGALNTVEPRENSVVPEYLRRLRLDTPMQFSQICMKDSRRLNWDDREALAVAIEQSEAKRCVVTHGTFTLPETAVYLERHLRRTDKVVVLVSAVIPLEGMTMSDGGFNLGYAFARLEDLSPGVHICVHGRIYPPMELAQRLVEGRFTTIFSSLPEA